MDSYLVGHLSLISGMNSGFGKLTAEEWPHWVTVDMTITVIKSGGYVR